MSFRFQFPFELRSVLLMLCKFPCLIDGFHLIELSPFLWLLDLSGNDETVVRLSVFLSISLTFQASLTHRDSSRELRGPQRTPSNKDD